MRLLEVDVLYSLVHVLKSEHEQKKQKIATTKSQSTGTRKNKLHKNTSGDIEDTSELKSPGWKQSWRHKMLHCEKKKKKTRPG